jgi:hypothetical protein
MADAIKIGFVIKGYPSTGRKVEEESDLSQVSAPDLLQGAFMGDAIFELNEVDFGTRFGWVTLIYWCLGLANATRRLKENMAPILRFGESDDFISFRLHGASVLVASSYRPGIAIVEYDAFKNAVQCFVDEQLLWISSNYPSAFMNPAMGGALSRVGVSFPA